MNLITSLENLLLERQRYEDEIYDLLVAPLNFIPESFWEPVRISFDINHLTDNYIYNECSICVSNTNHFKIMKCCNQLMCAKCSENWFKLSVMCPYCNRDLREFI
jgi:hypothetical protein